MRDDVFTVPKNARRVVEGPSSFAAWSPGATVVATRASGKLTREMTVLMIDFSLEIAATAGGAATVFHHWQDVVASHPDTRTMLVKSGVKVFPLFSGFHFLIGSSPVIKMAATLGAAVVPKVHVYSDPAAFEDVFVRTMKTVSARS